MTKLILGVVISILFILNCQKKSQTSSNTSNTLLKDTTTIILSDTLVQKPIEDTIGDNSSDDIITLPDTLPSDYIDSSNFGYTLFFKTLDEENDRSLNNFGFHNINFEGSEIISAFNIAHNLKNSVNDLNELVAILTKQFLWKRVGTEYSFMKYVDPKTVEMLKNNWVPDPQKGGLGKLFQKYYKKSYAGFFRYLKRGEFYLQRETDFEKESEKFTKVINSGVHSPSYIENRFGIPFYDAIEYENYNDINLRSTDVIGFWLRRKMDSSYDEISAALEKILTLYDNEWYDSLKAGTIQKIDVPWIYQDNSKALNNIIDDGFHFETSTEEYATIYSMPYSKPSSNVDEEVTISWFIDPVTIDSVSFDTESSERSMRFVSVGEVINGRYRGATLIRVECGDQDGRGKFGWEFEISYVLRLQDKLILLKGFSNYYIGSEGPFTFSASPRKYYPKNWNYPNESPFYRGVHHVINDFSINIKGLYPNSESSRDLSSQYEYSFKNVKDILYDGKIPDQVIAYCSVYNGLLYATAPNYFVRFDYDEGDVESISNCIGEECFTLGGYYFFRPDGSAICYTREYYDESKINFSKIVPLGSKQINKSAEYVPYNSCECNGRPTEFSSRYSYVDLLENNLQASFLIDYDTIFTIKGKHEIVDKMYEGLTANWKTWNMSSSVPSRSNFYNSMPKIFTRGEFGWISWTNTDYLPPANCEPFVYIYGDSGKNVKISLDKSVKLLTTDPVSVNNSWEIILVDEGKFQIKGSDKLQHRIFWEGIQGALPPLQNGWVVARDSLTSFLTEKLTFLGLNQLEINEFIDAWLEDLSQKPFCFIGFYPEEIISSYAPMHINPKPDQIIRILMDYRLLDVREDVKPAMLSAVKRSDGLLVVEWGGIKRFN